MQHYDVIVIGSGGGSKITRPAANLGHKVAVFEKNRLGGTCLNEGCIPSKMLIHSADVATHIRTSERFEITSALKNVAFTKLLERVNQTTDYDSDSITRAYNDHPNIDFYPHEAHFINDKIIESNGEQFSADKIFIATGAAPNLPKEFLGTPYLTYREALRLRKQPKSLTIVGGGYIASELGYFFAALGTEVTFIVRSKWLSHEDNEIRKAFTKAFEPYFNVLRPATIEKVSYDGQFHLETTKGSVTSDEVLLATGVTPQTAGFKHASPYIEVNEYLETPIDGVYAFGDCIGGHHFRHAANFEGEYLFKRAFESHPEPIKYPPMPHAVFTRPQVASIGKTEEELIEGKTPYLKGTNNYADSAMGMALRSENGLVKLLFHAKTKKLLGAHIIGEEASNMIHMCIAYMQMGATHQDMLDTIYIHPALPENIRNATRNTQ